MYEGLVVKFWCKLTRGMKEHKLDCKSIAEWLVLKLGYNPCLRGGPFPCQHNTLFLWSP